MKRNDKTRHAASDALIALREALKMSQAQFAVLVLDSAITTVGRYETTHPPQGDLLLRLAKIAEQETVKEGRSPAEQEIFKDLNDRFKELYIQDAREKLDGDMLMFPRTDAEQEHAYLLMRVNGEGSMNLANDFWVVARALEAKDENNITNEVIAARVALEKAAEAIRGRIGVETARLFTALMANPAQKNSPTPETSGKRSKKQ